MNKEQNKIKTDGGVMHFSNNIITGDNYYFEPIVFKHSKKRKKPLIK